MQIMLYNLNLPKQPMIIFKEWEEWEEWDKEDLLQTLLENHKMLKLLELLQKHYKISLVGKMF